MPNNEFEINEDMLQHHRDQIKNMQQKSLNEPSIKATPSIKEQQKKIMIEKEKESDRFIATALATIASLGAAAFFVAPKAQRAVELNSANSFMEQEIKENNLGFEIENNKINLPEDLEKSKEVLLNFEDTYNFTEEEALFCILATAGTEDFDIATKAIGFESDRDYLKSEGYITKAASNVSYEHSDPSFEVFENMTEEDYVNKVNSYQNTKGAR